MILGYNIFYGSNFLHFLKDAAQQADNGKATIFGYYVNDPHRFGIVEFDAKGNVISVEEKPEHPKSNYAITGLYFYLSRGVNFNKAKDVTQSARNRLRR